MAYISYLFQPPPQRKDDANFADEELHSQAKSKAKQKFKIFPSAYASSYIVQEYKRLYKQKHGSDSKAFTSKDDRTDDLRAWYAENWKAINSSGKVVGECGSGETKGKVKCLPEKKAESLSEEERAKLAKRKQRKDPNASRGGAPIMVSSKLDDLVSDSMTSEQLQYACDLINVRMDAGAKCKVGKLYNGRCVPQNHLES